MIQGNGGFCERKKVHESAYHVAERAGTLKYSVGAILSKGQKRSASIGGWWLGRGDRLAVNSNFSGSEASGREEACGGRHCEGFREQEGEGRVGFNQNRDEAKEWGQQRK